MRSAWRLAVVLMVIGLAPVAATWIARGIASLAGCTISTTFPQPCMIGGADRGAALNALVDLGNLMLLTAPVALVGIALGIGLAVFSLVRRARD